MSNDAKIVQRGVVGAGAGDDIYILSEYQVEADATITITDTQGVSTIQCMSGLTLLSSQITANTLLLTLENGAQITILDAATMQYQVGGDPVLGEPGVLLTFEEFVQQELKSALPDTGALLTGPSVVIGQNEYAGKVIDGFIKDAFVFADANGNGVYDEGEASTTTDALGNFELAPGAAGKLYSIGGTDISTGLAFTGSMTAPAGAKVITPSTTLVNDLVQSGLSTTAAQKLVNQALGLPEDTDLINIDPLTDLDNNDDQGNDNDLMLQIHAANLKLATAMTQMGAVLKGAGGGQLNDEEAFTAASEAMAEELLKGNTSGSDGGEDQGTPTLDLTQQDTVKKVLASAAEKVKTKQQDNDAFDPDAFTQRLEQAQDNASKIITTTTGKIRDAMDDDEDHDNPIEALKEAVKIQGVAHGQGKEDLEKGTSQGNTGDLLDDYDDQSLADKANDFDEPDNVVTGENQEPEPETPTPPTTGGGGGGPVAPPSPSLSLTEDTGSSTSDWVTKNGEITVKNLTSGKAWQYSVDGGQNWKDGVITSKKVTVGDSLDEGDTFTLTINGTQVEYTIPNSPAPREIHPDRHYLPSGPTKASVAAGLKNKIDNDATLSQAITDGKLIVTDNIDGTLSIFSTDGALTITSGTTNGGANAGQTLSVTDGTGAGRFTLDAATYNADQIQVRYTDASDTVIAKNSSKIDVDQTNPGTTSGTVLVSDSGIDAADKITNTATGLKGTAEAGAKVEVLSGQTSVGTATADDQGAWTLTTDLSAYSEVNLTITQTDLAGNSAASAETFTFTLDTEAPTSSFGSASTVNIDASASTLTLEPGDTVAAESTEKGEAWLVLKSESPTTYSDLTTLQTNGKAVKASLNNTTHDVDLSTAGLSEGDYKLITVDLAGNLSANALFNTDKDTVQLVDTTAPAKPSLELVNTSDSGTSNSDGISNQKTPTVKVTLPNGNTAAATDALVGDTVTVYSGTDSNKTSVGTIVLTASHITAGSVDITLNDLGADDDKTLTATITDQSSQKNESDLSTALTYTLDTTAPAAAPSVTAISLSKDTSAKDQDDTAEDAQDTGDSDLITKHAAQTLTFTLDAGSALGDGESLYVTSGTGDNAQWTIATKDGTDSSGLTYTLSDQALTAGDTTYQFAIGDAAGNRGTAQTQQNSEFTVTLDTTAPTKLVSGIALSDDTGASDSDGVTNTASQTITATLSAGLATGETLWGSYSTNNGRTEWVDITNKVNGQSVSWDGLTLDASGTIKLEVRDAAGNAGSVAQGQTDTQSQDYVVDTTAPETTITGATYDATTNTLTLTGTKFNELLGSAEDGTTDIKGRLDWNKITWDIEGDGDTTTNVTFSKDDITKAVVDSDTGLMITLTSAAVGAMPEKWDGALLGNATGNDKIVIDAGFTADAAGNVGTSDEHGKVNTKIVVFDTVNGVSSSHSDRKFSSDVSYQIYIIVDSDANELNMREDNQWRAAGNLSSDDQVTIVGDTGKINLWVGNSIGEYDANGSVTMGGDIQFFKDNDHPYKFNSVYYNKEYLRLDNSGNISRFSIRYWYVPHDTLPAKVYKENAPNGVDAVLWAEVAGSIAGNHPTPTARPSYQTTKLYLQGIPDGVKASQGLI